jgi:hypothetical protein
MESLLQTGITAGQTDMARGQHALHVVAHFEPMAGIPNASTRVLAGLSPDFTEPLP